METKNRGNTIAKDLRTPKYKMRVVVSKKAFKRQPKHRSLEQ
jgi:hypothetical protein